MTYGKLGIPDAYREQVNKDIAASIPVGSEIVVDGGRLLNR